MQNPDIEEMISSYLRANGYSGLLNQDIDCGCEVNDLCPCGELDPTKCFAGYKTMCSNLCTHEIQHDNINNSWHIQETKDEKTIIKR